MVVVVVGGAVVVTGAAGWTAAGVTEGRTHVAGVTDAPVGTVGLGATVVGTLAARRRCSWCFTALRWATWPEGAVVADVAVDVVAAVTLTAPAVRPAAHTAPSAQLASGFILVHLSSRHLAERPVSDREVEPAGGG